MLYDFDENSKLMKENGINLRSVFPNELNEFEFPVRKEELIRKTDLAQEFSQGRTAFE